MKFEIPFLENSYIFTGEVLELTSTITIHAVMTFMTNATSRVQVEF